MIKKTLFKLLMTIFGKQISKRKNRLKSERNDRELAKIHFYKTSLMSERYSDPRCLTRSGFKNFSQFDEDGIINEIFTRIGTTNKIFLEIGVGDGFECNTHSLLYQGFTGYWIEGSEKFCRKILCDFEFLLKQNKLQLLNKFVTKENINSIISEKRINKEIDLLSIDIDGNDFHIMKNIISINPRVVVMEYNAKFGACIDWVMQYNKSHQSDKTSYFGASLKALENLMNNKGYCLVGCGFSGANAFFVRKDLVTEDKFMPPFTSEMHFEDCKYSIAWEYRSGLKDGVGPFTDSVQLLKND